MFFKINFSYSPLQVEEKGFDDVKTGLVGIVLRGVIQNWLDLFIDSNAINFLYIYRNVTLLDPLCQLFIVLHS